MLDFISVVQLERRKYDDIEYYIFCLSELRIEINARARGVNDYLTRVNVQEAIAIRSTHRSPSPAATGYSLWTQFSLHLDLL